jgi:PAS domain S-box-containing protein
MYGQSRHGRGSGRKDVKEEQDNQQPSGAEGEIEHDLPIYSTTGDEVFCLLDSEELEFKVGIVGAGPGFKSILEIISSDTYSEFLPVMRVSALAEPGEHKGKIKKLTEEGVPLYPSCEEMIENHPEINLVVELVGKPHRVRQIRKALPDNVSFIDHNSAVFLCGLHSMLVSSEHFKTNMERHRALFRAVIDEVKEDILLLDRNRRVVDMNKNVLERAGMSKEELTGKHCWDVQCLDLDKHFCGGPDRQCPFDTTLKTREAAESLVTRVDQEGRLRYFRVYTYPVFNRYGGLDYVMVLRRDITRRTWRERHQQQREKLSVIGEMSTYLAHEMRNPLFAIGGFTKSLLKSEEMSEKDREKLDIINQEVDRLDKLLTSVLNFARPEELESAAADLSEVARDTADLMKIGYAGRGYDFELELQEELPRVRGEAEMLKQCLINLLKNAVEAMPGGGSVTLRAELRDDWVVLEVEDRGKGMSEAEMEKAFSPFYSTKEQGYGLGLAMIKKIVEDFGGRVEIQSQEGRGTTVTLFLAPVLAVDEEAETAD